ncbi:MAG: immunoglobulin-like domain-containing protein [Bacillota bacterium]
MMRLLKVFILFVLLLTLSACNTDDSDENPTHYIELTSLTREFTVGDSVPDWEDYFSLVGEAYIETFEVNSDFEFVSTFGEEGTFQIQVKITLKTGVIIYESFDIEVVAADIEETTSYSASKLKIIFDRIVNPLYLSYHADNDLEYTDASESITLSIDSEYKHYIDPYTGENGFFYRNDYHSSTLGSHYEETYYQVFEDGVYFVQKSTDNPEWLAYTMGIDDILGQDLGFSNISLSDLVSQFETLEAKIADGKVEYKVPLSKENFSLGAIPEMLDAMLLYGLLGDNYDAGLIETIEDNYDLIVCEVVTNITTTELISITFNYTELMNELLSISGSDIQLLATTSEFMDATLIYTNYSTEYLYFAIPVVQPVLLVDYLPHGMTFTELNKEILSSYIDTENNSIYYTLVEDHYLYKFNYETYVLEQLYFDIRPDQVFYRDGNIYITLSDQHLFIWEAEDQYGGIAIVDAITFTVVRELALNFDPYDIVVDEDGFIYVTNGSNQHGNIISISPISGQIINSMFGVYYGTELYYSDYTHRLYSFQVTTTYDSIEVWEVMRGDFLSGGIQGADDMDDYHITMTSDGKHIMSGNGKVVSLNSTLSLDAKEVEYIDLIFFQAAFDKANDTYYFASNGVIYKSDENYEIIGYFGYNGSSQEMAVDDQLLINIGTSSIEIYDFGDSSNENLTIIATASYGIAFDIDQYLEGIVDNRIEYRLSSGSVNTNQLGQVEVIYEIISIDGVDSNGYIHVFVNVVDNIAPVITLPSDTLYEINVNTSFTPPLCSVTDNFDATLTCEVLKNDVDTTKIGNYEVSYISTDSSGNTRKEVFIFTVVLPTISYDITTFNFTGIISDAVYDMTTNAIYYILANTYEVIKFNLTTSTTSRIAFLNPPETLHMHDGLLYVTIVHAMHSSYWMEDEQTGELAIIDMATFTKTAQISFELDPYDVVVTDSLIFITSGSGQHVSILVIDQTNYNNQAKLCRVYQGMIIEGGQGLDEAIYGITTLLSPQSLVKFDPSLTSCLKWEDPSFEYYDYGNKIFVSPNNDYVWSEYGDKFYQVGTEDNYLLDYAGSMGFSISSMYFDNENGATFFGQANGYVYISYSNTYLVSEEVYIGYKIDYIYADTNTIYIISFINNGVTLIVAERGE